MIQEEKIRKSFAVQAHWCSKLGSPFTALLLEQLGQRIDRSTQTGRTLLDWRGEPTAMGDAIALRLAGALHGLVRAGKLLELAKLYPPNTLPSANILADVASAAIVEADSEICEWLAFAPQTNEVARSSLLYAGMGVVAGETGLPLSIFELGASAGLNLMLDRFAYNLAGKDYGAKGSSLSLSPKWTGPAPQGVEPKIIAKRGCDLNPLDVTDSAHRARLLAYIWPDQPERLARTEAAIEIALVEPPQLDKADAGDWVEEMITLAPRTRAIADTIPARGNRTTQVLFHSIAYQYFPPDVKKRIATHVEAVGALATPNTPLAWLAFEQVEGLGPTLTLRLWRGEEDDGETRVLAKASNAHVHSIEWHQSSGCRAC